MLPEKNKIRYPAKQDTDRKVLVLFYDRMVQTNCRYTVHNNYSNKMKKSKVFESNVTKYTFKKLSQVTAFVSCESFFIYNFSKSTAPCLQIGQTKSSGNGSPL